jgi:hypothetical protein
LGGTLFDAPEATEADPIDPDLEHRLARIPEWGTVCWVL